MNIFMIVILLVHIPMEIIPVLIENMRIRRCVLGGVSENGINDIPLVFMMVFQSHLRYTIKIVLMFTPGISDSFDHIF